jgi:hypothetical protein
MRTVRARAGLIAMGVFFAALSGCGYKFAHDATPPNATDVAALKVRTVLPSANGSYIDNWDQLVGNILYEVSDGPGCKSTKLDPTLTVVALKTGCSPNVVKTPRVLMQGAFTGGMNVGSTYVIGSSNAAANLAFDATVSDIGTILAPYSTCMPEAFKDDLRPAEACRALWVEGVAVTTITTKEYTDTNGETTINGTAFSLNGKVFSSNRNSTTDYVISINTRLAKKYNSAVAPPVAPESAGDAHPVVLPEHLNELLRKAPAASFRVDRCSSAEVRNKQQLDDCYKGCNPSGDDACRRSCDTKAQWAVSQGCWKE